MRAMDMGRLAEAARNYQTVKRNHSYMAKYVAKEMIGFDAPVIGGLGWCPHPPGNCMFSGREVAVAAAIKAQPNAEAGIKKIYAEIEFQVCAVPWAYVSQEAVAKMDIWQKITCPELGAITP
jgi:hypothetical protein